MAFIDSIYEKAKAVKKRVAVPECTNPSMMRSCIKAAGDQTAEILFVGDKEQIQQVAREQGLDISGIAICDINDEAYIADLTERFGEYPYKSLGKKYVSKRMNNPLYMALVMEAVGDADCTFGGLDTTTNEFVLAAGGIIGLAENCIVPSGILIMEQNDFEGVQGNIFGMSDGAINTEPTAEQLASIAIACCDSYQALIGKQAKCAMLSYSTDGSGNSPSVFKMREARDLAQKQRPDLLIDGEFQADAAVNARVGAKKVKRESAVAGQANVLIFPDAAACNIATKLIQQFAQGNSFGPIYQGFRKPVLDCSRGDTEDRIYDNLAVCSVMAAEAE